jgi:hypothetical protein
MRAIALTLTLATLLACGADEPSERELGESLAKDYAAAACRLYTEEACALGEDDICGQDLGFDDPQECESLLWVTLLAANDGLFPALAANEEIVLGCVDLLDGVDCAVNEPCNDYDYVLDYGDCAELNAIIAEHLPGWQPF